ncbi:uncharacterized protein L969DRAFT_557826 [Mixia osmundae IAM 14324]|uniref:Uncharacterized protein n=1 Tax=Mixia osmundae (strain CBS 9802 / IAM 14324 / JCM 22182 / KY 12970) TaxID=764103 RepID=G7DSI9_MIXOS|nr:uncharacterized protein L969DRAFT_557826 [Mixia osmundae IAM 14324]KEI37953.1 hypothetical protein L969DRAFT_557826 [Mixia osmundae IAM 14324]GAA93549.1 hypothetical protein E5Q_00193 [Mixia osmundae IAM 14324]
MGSSIAYALLVFAYLQPRLACSFGDAPTKRKRCEAMARGAGPETSAAAALHRVAGIAGENAVVAAPLSPVTSGLASVTAFLLVAKRDEPLQDGLSDLISEIESVCAGFVLGGTIVVLQFNGAGSIATQIVHSATHAPALLATSLVLHKSPSDVEALALTVASILVAWARPQLQTARLIPALHWVCHISQYTTMTSLWRAKTSSSRKTMMLSAAFGSLCACMILFALDGGRSSLVSAKIIPLCACQTILLFLTVDAVKYLDSPLILQLIVPFELLLTIAMSKPLFLVPVISLSLAALTAGCLGIYVFCRMEQRSDHRIPDSMDDNPLLPAVDQDEHPKSTVTLETSMSSKLLLLCLAILSIWPLTTWSVHKDASCKPFQCEQISLGRWWRPPARVAHVSPSAPAASKRKASLHANTETLGSIDLVVSFYDESPSDVLTELTFIRSLLPAANLTTYVYSKSATASLEELRDTLGADHVAYLPNVGREGGTYLDHIISHYDRQDFADHTLFTQAHLSYREIAERRLGALRSSTDYLHLAPYVPSECGLDQRVWFMLPRLREIVNYFNAAPNSFCHGRQLASWAAQFIVSRRKIMARTVEQYQTINTMIGAPEAHWIYADHVPEGWDWGGQGNNPGNNYFGHSLERAWPVIFGCDDVRIADECPDESADPLQCQCLNTSV